MSLVRNVIVQIQSLPFPVDIAPGERNKLFRKYVSEPGAGKARAVLEGLGLEDGIIDECFENHPRKVVETVQEGLVKWKEVKAMFPPGKFFLRRCTMQALDSSTLLVSRNPSAFRFPKGMYYTFSILPIVYHCT